jgi:spermidine/putrescine transport system substrate-binding protein
MPARRIARPLALVASIVFVLAACGPGTAPQESGSVELQVLNFAGYMPPDIGDRFEAATGHTIVVTESASNEDTVAKLDASQPGAYDVAFLTSSFAEALNNGGKLEQLDHDQIPNYSNIVPEATELPHDVGNVFSVPYTWGTTGICYRTDLVTTEIDSWYDLLTPSEELTGLVTLMDEERWLMLPGLKALGYSMNSTDEAELEAAGDLLIAAKDTMLKFDAETFYTLLDSGEALAVEAWDGWCDYAENPNHAFVIPEEGSDLFVDTMTIPIGSTRLAAAHEFINFILEEENGTWVPENIAYKVPTSAMDLLSEETLDAIPTLRIPPATLFEQEALRDLGDGQSTFSDAATRVKTAE